MQSIGSKVIVRRLLFFLTLIFLLGLPASIRLIEIQKIPTGNNLIVEKGQGINSIIDSLKNQNNNNFLTILKLKYLFESTNIIPGRYEIKPSMTYVEFMEDIFDGNFVARENPNTFKMNLQSAYVDGLINAMSDERYDEISRSAIFNSLLKIRNYSNSSYGNKMVKGHFDYLNWKINSALK